jgi:multiple sugar transport system substrate-binding protein
VQAASRKIDLIQNGKLTRAGIIPHGGDWYYIGWMWSAGGDIVDSTGKKCIWNSPAGVKALDFMSGTVAKYGGIGKIGSAGDFWGGRCGMEINGSWMLGEWKKNKQKKFELGVGYPPRPAGLEKEHMTWGAGFGMCIPKGSKHPKEAWTFIKYYCTNKEAQLALGVPSGQIPTLRAAALDKKFLDSDHNMRWFVDLMSDARHLPVIPTGPELWDLYSVAVTNQLTAGKKSPREILDSTVKEGQKILDRGWKRVRQL